MFGFGKKVFKSAKKAANQNQMEAIVAGAMLVAAADGEIERSELAKLEALIANNENMSAFKRQEIQKVIQKYSGILEADFHVGRSKMLKEIGDVSDNPEAAEEVFLNMLAIAKSDGEIEPAEAKVLIDVARRIGVDASEYGVAV